MSFRRLSIVSVEVFKSLLLSALFAEDTKPDILDCHPTPSRKMFKILFVKVKGFPAFSSTTSAIVPPRRMNINAVYFKGTVISSTLIFFILPSMNSREPKYAAAPTAPTMKKAKPSQKPNSARHEGGKARMYIKSSLGDSGFRIFGTNEPSSVEILGRACNYQFFTEDCQKNMSTIHLGGSTELMADPTVKRHVITL